MTKLLAASGAFLAITVASQGALLLNEPFAYTDGQLTTVSSPNWANLSGTGTFLQVAGGEVVNLTHGTGSREDATRVFSNPSITSTTIYTAALITVNTAPTAGADYFLAVHPLTTSNFRGRVFLSAPATAAAGAFRFGLENDGTTPAVLTSDLLASSGPFQLVVGFNPTTNTSQLWVGSSFADFSLGSPTLVDATAAAPEPLGFGRVVLRQGGGITVANSIDVDNVQVTTQFQLVPEPTTLALLAVGGLAILRRRK